MPKASLKRARSSSAGKSTKESRDPKKAAEHVKKPKEVAAPAEDPVEAPVVPAKEEEHTESMIRDLDAKRRTSDKVMTNRQKCLVLGGRNMNSKARHLLLDLRGLMPHSREHSKLGGGAQHHNIGSDLVELCGLHMCNSFLYMDPHRSDVTYLWLGQAPAGPSVKLQISNIHTAEEIRMAGNCLKYSRPLLHFDRAFETTPHLRVVKSLLHMAFNTPRYHPKSKPFIDRIMSFFYLDNHIWVRNYQIVYPSNGSSDHAEVPTPQLMSSKSKNATSVLEIGPRFTLEPVLIMNGCCQGNVLWRSQIARAPTEQRRDRKQRRLEKIERNEVIGKKSEKHHALHPPPMPDPLDMVFQ